MNRTTRSEAAFVLKISYRTLRNRCKNAGIPSDQRGFLTESQLKSLGITPKMIEEARKRASEVDRDAKVAACRQCLRDGRPCRDHQALFTLVPVRQMKLWQ